MPIEKGTLVRWMDEKGFGFITPENGKNDIFIHISALKSSRKPIIGDTILYEADIDANGKSRAVNAIIEGVSQSLTLSSLEQKCKTDRPSPINKRTHRNPKARASNPKKSLNLFPILIVIGLAVFIYGKVSKEKSFIDQVKTPTFEIEPIKHAETFTCQGKVWCTEMRSYEEAKFYLDNCPGTKMDGDHDGEPCESQF